MVIALMDGIPNTTHKGYDSTTSEGIDDVFFFVNYLPIGIPDKQVPVSVGSFQRRIVPSSRSSDLHFPK